MKFLLSVILLFLCNPLFAAVQHARFVSGSRYLVVETLKDDLIHFEYSTTGSSPDVASPLHTSPRECGACSNIPTFSDRLC
jgi:hypothetical protein